MLYKTKERSPEQWFVLVFDKVQYIFLVILSLFNLAVSQFLDHRSHISCHFFFFLLPVCKPDENVSRKLDSGRGREGELGETEDSESNCRCSEKTRLGMVTESQNTMEITACVHTGTSRSRENTEPL